MPVRDRPAGQHQVWSADFSRRDSQVEARMTYIQAPGTHQQRAQACLNLLQDAVRSKLLHVPTQQTLAGLPLEAGGKHCCMSFRSSLSPNCISVCWFSGSRSRELEISCLARSTSSPQAAEIRAVHSIGLQALPSSSEEQVTATLPATSPY